MSEQRSAGDLVLVIDTSTRSSVVAIGRERLEAVSRRDVQHRHGSHVLAQVEEALDAASVSIDEVTAIAVGTGPGSFTGLRVGLATAKTIAYTRSLPLIAVMSSDALRRAAVDEADAAADVAVVLPAGARDHYLARAGQDPVLVAPGGLAEMTGGDPVLSVDTDPDVLGSEAARLGTAALAGLPSALLALAWSRHLDRETTEVAELVPAYVALPRGVRRAAEELGWSPDLR